MKSHSRFLRTTVAVALSAVLAGCAVAPQPFTESERAEKLRASRAAMYQDQEPVTGAVTLAEAMGRAIMYNLDRRLKVMEEAVSRRQLDLSRYDLLPKLVASAGYTARDSLNASSSMSVITFTESLEPSTSQERDHTTGDLALTWNVLDFGVSWYQAQQNADRALVATERKRKVVHNLMQQVRQAYWKAVGAQRLEHKVGPLLAEVERALEDSRRIERERLMEPLEVLRYQKALIEITRQLEGVRDELTMAKPQLAALMNMAPGEAYELALPEGLAEPELGLPLETMEEVALLNRPEIREAEYQERIGLHETRKAVARMFPGLEFNFNGNHDSNSYLVNNSWSEGGLRITWNLLNIFSGPKAVEFAEAQEEVARTQRLALNMAVLSQVHVAYREFHAAQRQFRRAATLADINERILEQLQRGVEGRAQNRLEEIRGAVGALMAELRQYQSFASLHNAYGRIQVTLGLDPIPDEVASHDLSALTAAIDKEQAGADR